MQSKHNEANVIIDINVSPFSFFRERKLLNFYWKWADLLCFSNRYSRPKLILATGEEVVIIINIWGNILIF